MTQEEQYLRDEREAICRESGVPEFVIAQIVEDEALARNGAEQLILEEIQK